MSGQVLARSLADPFPTIRAQREEAEQVCQLLANLARSLRESGTFSLCVPRALGGREASPTDLMAPIEEMPPRTAWPAGER